MERWSAYETKHDENGEEIVTKLEVDWRDYKHIRDLERTLNSTYPIEGRYSSATDRDYILSLPDYDRESALANRAKAVAKAERNFELAKQQSYHRILKRKRDDTASIEQPSRALPANRAEALAMLHKLEGHKNKKTADPEIKKRKRSIDEREMVYAGRRAERFELQRLMTFVKRSDTRKRDGLEGVDGHASEGDPDD